ncbi:hypothetical protein PDL71_09220 [Lacibacter sp. MH-610]|uniref:hypothetical protein n=1 Tax=Lacibacter sp. MH-610 TaxID=3020883 RepID=UPI0038926DB3
MTIKINTSIAAIFLCFSCYKKPPQPNELPVTKTVQFQIAQARDYSAPVYDGLKIELKLSVAKENIKDGKVLALWDTTFSLRSIREFAVTAAPFTLSKQFNDIWQSSQVLRVSRAFKYVDAANQVTQNGFGETIPAAVEVKQFPVNL